MPGFQSFHQRVGELFVWTWAVVHALSEIRPPSRPPLNRQRRNRTQNRSRLWQYAQEMRRLDERASAEANVLATLSLRTDPFSYLGLTSADAHSWVREFATRLWLRIVGSIPNHQEIPETDFGYYFDEALLWRKGIVELMGDPQKWCGKVDLQYISAALVIEARIAQKELTSRLPVPDPASVGADQPPASSVLDSAEWEGWRVSVDEFAYDGRGPFRISGRSRQLLLAFVRAHGGPLDGKTMKCAAGNPYMSNDTLRDHLKELRNQLRRDLGANPIQLTERIRYSVGVYRLAPRI